MDEQEFVPEPLELPDDLPQDADGANINTLRQSWQRLSEAYDRVERLQPLARAISGMPNSAPFPVVVDGVKITYRQKDGTAADAVLSNIFNVGDVSDLFDKELERLADILVYEFGVISSVAAALQQICQNAKYASRMQQSNFTQ